MKPTSSELENLASPVSSVPSAYSSQSSSSSSFQKSTLTSPKKVSSPKRPLPPQSFSSLQRSSSFTSVYSDSESSVNPPYPKRVKQDLKISTSKVLLSSKSSVLSSGSSLTVGKSSPALSNKSTKHSSGQTPLSAKSSTSASSSHSSSFHDKNPPIEDEEPDTEVDLIGESKITVDGILLGKRIFKVPTFVIPERHPTRHYMFAPDVAKCIGQRDGFTLFMKYPQLTRLWTTESQREYLTQVGLLSSHLRSRNITLITARTVFRHFGHAVIKKGKPIRDDYWVYGQVYEEEDSSSSDEDTIMTPKRVPPSTLPRPSATLNDYASELKLPMLGATSSKMEWMYYAALSCREFNSRLCTHRQQNGVIPDIHTGIPLVPSEFGSTHFTLQQLQKPHPNGLHPLHHVDPPCTYVSTLTSPSKWNFLDSKPTEYPLALMQGQSSEYLSLFLSRFPHTPPSSIPLTYTQPTYALSSKEIYHPRQGLYCAGTCYTGEPCRRMVQRSGAFCMYHAAQAQGCVNCHQDGTHVQCNKCAKSYHFDCLHMPPLTRSSVTTYPWHCSDCKLCTVCDATGIEDQLLFCDHCERGWHMYCLVPALTQVPPQTWLCPLCHVCSSCGARDVPVFPKCQGTCYYGTYCSECSSDFQLGDICMICLKTRRHATVSSASESTTQGSSASSSSNPLNSPIMETKASPSNDVLVAEMGLSQSTSRCEQCHRYVHPTCEGGLVDGLCPLCDQRITPLTSCIVEGHPIQIPSTLARGHLGFFKQSGVVLMDDQWQPIKTLVMYPRDVVKAVRGRIRGRGGRARGFRGFPSSRGVGRGGLGRGRGRGRGSVRGHRWRGGSAPLNFSVTLDEPATSPRQELTENSGVDVDEEEEVGEGEEGGEEIEEDGDDGEEDGDEMVEDDEMDPAEDASESMQVDEGEIVDDGEAEVLDF
ncbi:hypothetical protein HMI54_005284 [Coelomomyces lativittatus]|nr:hypothetical protein HMI54_005284 [Coelomomyces lativittatus]KAJ1506171.1 hypothetical protein HMI56_000731 [Coelomomyces lativittatus]KAJ1507057.1 hypothetical protein HMI55_000925 [Coelomomyces lativittatus]